MIRQPMVRRSALGSPYSKPSTVTATAEDGLQHPASRWHFLSGYHFSIAVALTLCNAATGLGVAWRLTLW